MFRTTLLKSAMLTGLLGAPLLSAPLPAAAFVSIGISVGIAPPPLPVYVQPVAPGPGYIWTPGYWAWDGTEYYWVPGTWVLPPEVGVLWTPGWWGWDAGFYRWHPGYWGPRVGFYGGINYGFGYFGVGYVGGYWHGRDFYYNRAVNNINVTNIRNVYVDKTVVNNYNNSTVNRVSYNGGRGGIEARPTPQQLAAANERHFDPTPAQLRQRDLAMRNPEQRFSVNHGNPGILATPRPGNFASPHVVRNETAMSAPHAAAMAPHNAAMARPDGFVHAPRANDGMPPERMQSSERGFAPERANMAPQRGQFERSQATPQMPREPNAQYEMPHQNHAPPQMHTMNRAAQPRPPAPAPRDRRDDHDHPH